MYKKYKAICVSDDTHYKLMKRKAEGKYLSANAVIAQLMENEVQNGKTQKDGRIVQA